MQLPHLFLSYSNPDVDFAIHLATDLSNAGVQVWMDRLEVASVDDWESQLREGMIRSCGIVSILSANYLSSKYTQREFAVFRKRNRPVVPLLLGGLSQEAAAAFAAQEVIDFSRWRQPHIYQDRFRLVLEMIQQRFPELVQPQLDSAMVYINQFLADRERSQTFITCLQNGHQKELGRFDSIRPQPIASRLNQIPGYTHVDMPCDQPPATMQPPQRIEDMQRFTRQNAQFFVTGATNADVTSALESMARNEAFQFKLSQGVTPLPFYVRLHKADFDLFSAIRSRWTLGGDPLEKLARGQIALFLDGIGAVPNQHDSMFERLHSWLQGDFAPQRIVVGCRTDHHEIIARFERPVVAVAELSREDFLRICAGYMTDDEAEEFVSSLEEPIDASDRSALMVFELARYPAILHALLMYHLTSNQQAIDSLADLIEWVLKTLWMSRTETISVAASFDDVHMRLASLARLMFSGDYLVSRSDALKYVSDASIFEALHAIGVLKSNDDDVQFTYDFFKHYFVMASLQEIDLARLIAKPTLNARYRLIPGKWDPILKLLVGRMPQPDKFIADITDIDPLLALDCSKVSFHLSEDMRLAILDRLEATADSETLIAAAFLLAEQADTRAVQFLTRAMRTGKWSARQAAAALLQSYQALPLLPFAEIGHSEDSETLLYLSRYLRHGEYRQQAAEALGTLHDPAAVPLLVSALSDLDIDLCIQAAAALGGLNDVEAVAPLIQLLDGQNRRVIRAAVQALVSLQAVSLDTVMQVVTSKGGSTQQKAHGLEVLSLTTSPRAHALVFRAARSSDLNMRAAAVKALRNLPGKEAIRCLSASLADTEKPGSGERPICDLAMESLVAIGSEDALAAFEQRQKKSSGASASIRSRRQPTASDVSPLRHPDWMIRREAVIRLAAAPPDTAIPQLVSVLHDEDNQVRLAVIHALTHFYQDERVVPLLLQALEDSDVLVSDAARDCLLKLAQRPLPQLLIIIRSANLNARAAAMQIAGALGEDAAVPDLIEGLSDLRRPWLSEQRICDIAADALNAIHTVEAQAAANHWLSLQPKAPPNSTAGFHSVAKINHLIDQIRSASWEERHEGAKNLRDLAQDIGEEAVGVLLAALQDSEWYVRWSVIEVLGCMKLAQAVVPLTERLGDPNMTVRIGAIRALAEIGDLQSAELIAVALRHDQAALVREAAAEALGKIGSAATEAALIQAFFDPEPFVVIAALKAVGERRCGNALEVLRPLLYTPDLMVRWWAAKTFCEIAPAECIPQLVLLLQDTEHPYSEEKRICDLAAEALQAIHTPAALQALENWKYDVIE